MPRSPRYRVTGKLGRVYLTDTAPAADAGINPDEALQLGEQLLLAAREAVRAYGPHQLRRGGPPVPDFTDPLWRSLVLERLAELWPSTRLSQDDMASIESTWHALKEGGW